jgi:hypothetical protein
MIKRNTTNEKVFFFRKTYTHTCRRGSRAHAQSTQNIMKRVKQEPRTQKTRKFHLYFFHEIKISKLRSFLFILRASMEEVAHSY